MTLAFIGGIGMTELVILIIVGVALLAGVFFVVRSLQPPRND